MNTAALQLKSLIEDCNDEISILSNSSALLNMVMDDISWVGFYLFKENELVLGPFQGKVACTNIKLQKGVCGNCAYDRKTYIVEDVHQFPGHIACDSASNSEIVVPIIIDDNLYGVLDLDSTSYARFTTEDQIMLEEFVSILTDKLKTLKA